MTTHLGPISKQFSKATSSSPPPLVPTEILPDHFHTVKMLCQRCSGLLRASRSSFAPTRAARRSLSSSAARPRHGLSATAAAWPRPLRAGQPWSIDTPAVSALHTTSSLHIPAAESQPSPPSTALEKPDFLDEAESTIWDRLVDEFSPVELVVQDISGGCGSMYGIEISSDKFRGANMLKQQRMVNAVLGDLMKGWHGCQLKTRVP